MLVENFELDNQFLVRTSGTSDGTQDKYFKDNKWFKLDRYGGEGIAETVASIILKNSGLDSSKFVEYHPCLINGKPGCYSENFLKPEDSFVTFYRLYKNVTGKDLAAVTSRMDYDDAIEYVLSFVKTQTGLDLHEYLANTFALDKLILNEDRHFNNLGILYNNKDFLPAPIFDNGKSFLIGNKSAYAKSFNPSFQINYDYLKKYSTFKIPQNLEELVQDVATPQMLSILRNTAKDF